MKKVYQTIIFDCDGVILDSNRLKTLAFEKISSRYGEMISSEFLQFHLANGGVSRFDKIAYLKRIVKKNNDVLIDEEFHLKEFGEYVESALLSCKISDGLADIRSEYMNQKWLVVSGSKETELKKIFKKRGIAKYFDGGIYGSPKDKYKIISLNLNRKNISGNTLFAGDSIYDKQVADFFGFDFAFISKWSECKKLKLMSDNGLIDSFPDISTLFGNNVKK